MQVRKLLGLCLLSLIFLANFGQARLEAEEKSSLFVRRESAQKVAPHPAVVRIHAFESKSYSCGSGTYVGEHGDYGLIITNWHVVRDSQGLMQVRFPDGFTTYAVTLLYDKTWDLAALAVTKPVGVNTVQIAQKAPAFREPLWVAGYGSGNYRMLGGHCVQYVAPKSGMPNEWLEVSVPSRMGDSGGPILNSQGELAGVLFGSDRYGTLGSYCGRVRAFTEQAMERFKAIPQEPDSLYAMVDEKGMRISLNPKNDNLVPVVKNVTENEDDLHLTALRDKERKNAVAIVHSEELDYLDPCSELAPDLYGPGNVVEIPSEKIAGLYDPVPPKGASGVGGMNEKSSDMVLPGAWAESTAGDKYSAQVIEQTNDSAEEAAEEAAEVTAVQNPLEQPHSQHSHSGNSGKERTVYIIIGILVTFFVLFNVVKMLSIIEEADPMLAQGEKS